MSTHTVPAFWLAIANIQIYMSEKNYYLYIYILQGQAKTGY